MRHILISFLFINILTSFSFGQILVGGNQPKEKEKKAKTVTQKSNISDTTVFNTKVFIGVGAASTYRSLNPNSNELFADSLGTRVNETPRIGWNFNLGFTTELNKYLMLEGGISYFFNGEKYAFKDSDTSHTYDSKYSWIGVPLKLHFKYDIKKFRISLGAGVIPQMQLKFRQESTTIDKMNITTDNTLKTSNGMNSFSISAIGTVGFHYNITRRFGVFLNIDYRHQLTSSYLKTNAYNHKGTAFGGTLGFTLGI